MRSPSFPSILHLLSSILVLSSLAAAPATTRTTRPATNDPSAPRAALLMYDKLVGPNESDKALGLYHATTTRERALADVLAKLDGALANLHAQATKKFNREAADDLIRVLDGATTDDINAADIKVTGDTAAVAFPNSTRPTQMVRVKGEWKISVKALAQDLQSNPREFRKALTKLAASANDIASKIQQGQYPTPAAAKKQLELANKSAFRQDDPTDKDKD